MNDRPNEAETWVSDRFADSDDHSQLVGDPDLIYWEAEAIRQNLPTVPGWAVPVLLLLSIANLVCAIALFKWKRWGFFGFTGTAVVAFAINLVSGISMIQGVVGLLGPIILYGVLQIGKEKKAWPQLE